VIVRNGNDLLIPDIDALGRLVAGVERE
jgi:hypothetical protein